MVRNGHAPKANLKLWKFIKPLGMLATLRICQFTFLTVYTCHRNNPGCNCATAAPHSQVQLKPVCEPLYLTTVSASAGLLCRKQVLTDTGC